VPSRCGLHLRLPTGTQDLTIQNICASITAEMRRAHGISTDAREQQKNSEIHPVLNLKKKRSGKSITGAAIPRYSHPGISGSRHTLVSVLTGARSHSAEWRSCVWAR
jgi:hypothetical protein